jgi:hypothetical protein
MTSLPQKTLFADALFIGASASARAGENLVEDPSFEETQDPNRFGVVFKKWLGWKFDGDCSFGVGQVAHSGKTSGLLRGTASPKIRLWAERELEPGRYRTTAWIRGLDIGTGAWNTTTEFMFNGKYMQLSKNGTFGWTKLTYVADVPEKAKVLGPSFGLMAPGLFWIDDVTLEKVGTAVPLTDAPVLGKEEAPITPPGPLAAGYVRCGECNYCLDGRAEDFNHLNGSPDGTLILDIVLEHGREGVDDYRRLLTLARLCKEKKGTPAAEAGEKLIAERLASFKLGQYDHKPMFPVEDYDAFRAKTNAAIDELR